MRSKNSHVRALYKILHDLDCELQMLGVRSDWGIQHTPQFASETLVCCLNFLSKQPDAGGDFLSDAAHSLLNMAVSSEKRDSQTDDGQPFSLDNPCFSMAESKKADDANTTVFLELLTEYRKRFQRPGQGVVAGDGQ
jgi:hypothetical protein